MTLPRLLLVALLALGHPVVAETSVSEPSEQVTVDRLVEAMHLPALFEVLREEGLAHGQRIEADMFPSGGGADWPEAVSRIYDVPRLLDGFSRALHDDLAGDPEALAEVVAFFESDLGRKVVDLEIDARRAFLDTAAEEAARVAADDAAAARDPKVALIRRMIEAGDLLEMNVAGGLSGSLAFMNGMASIGAYGSNMPADQILSDVWGQEEQIRAETSTWLYSFLGLAYAPLSEAELEAYVVFGESLAGQRLNGALFGAFDKVFRQVSHDLGQAAGRAILGRDI